MKIIYILVSLLLFIAALAVGTAAYWLFEEPKTYVTIERSILLDANGKETKEFRAGDTFRTHRWIYGYWQPKYIDAWRVLVFADTGEIVARENIATIPVPKGASERLARFTLPKDLKPGKYALRLQVSYPINPMRYESETLFVDYFEVVK